MKRCLLSALGLALLALACSFPSGEREAQAPEEARSSDTQPSQGGPAGLDPGTVGELNGLTLVYVPEGCFDMGSSEEEIAQAMQACVSSYEGAPFPCETSQYQREGPQNEVCLEPFWIGQTEVTNLQYAACVEAGACDPPVDRTYYDDPAFSDHPVTNVPWLSAAAYAAWAGGRLPTEAEWEYAARGRQARVYPWGDTFEKADLNYCDANCDVYFWADTSFDDGYALTAPDGTYAAGSSWVGALDMSGNVWEWVSSLFKEYPYDASDGREDAGAPGERVLRGGAFDLSYIDLRSAMRYTLPAGGTCRGYGFRIAADPEAVAVRED